MSLLLKEVRQIMKKHLKFGAIVVLGILAAACAKFAEDTVGVKVNPQDSTVTSVQKPGAETHRLHWDPRTAIKLECFYALNQGYGGGSNQSYAGYVTSDWSYLANDPNAYSVVKGWYPPVNGVYYASIWTGWPSFYTSMPTYSRSWYNRWGQNQGFDLSHAGQCKYFANLILFRSGIYQQKIPPYGRNPAGYRSYGQIRVGDVIETTWTNGHTAIVVKINVGVEGSSVTNVDVVDSNFIGDEVIGRHRIWTGGHGLTNLYNYRALNLPY